MIAAVLAEKIMECDFVVCGLVLVIVGWYVFLGNFVGLIYICWSRFLAVRSGF